MRSPWVLVVIACVLAFVAGLGWGPPPGAPDEIRFLDVGQGDATLLRFGGRAVLVDAGPPRAGERKILPTLRRLGVPRLDLLVITHPDDDHVGGVGEVLRGLPVDRVVVSAAFREHPDLAEDLRAWGLPEGKVTWLTGPARVRVGQDELRLVPPPADSDDNTASLLAHASFGGAGATLTGDAPFATERWAIGKGDWRAQVLKAGHHGSKGSMGNGWLRAVRPQVVVFSCGRNNRYGHPAPEAVARVVAFGAKVRRTDREGDVTLTARNGRWQE